MRPVLGLASILVSLATALALTAAVVAPFLAPAWVSFEQGRSNAAAWTGYNAATLEGVTDAILADLVVGPPDFDVRVGGRPVLSSEERAHMRDVRGVFAGFYLIAAGALAIAIAAWLVATRPNDSEASWTRPRYWRAVRRGALGLALVIAIAGAIAAVAFDAAFEFFHRLLFPAGTYDFDPRTYRLTQLFPDAFWSETSIVVGLAILAAAIIVAGLATWRLNGARQREMAPMAGLGR